LAWLKFALTVAVWMVLIVTVSLMLNRTGDCGPAVTNCGEAPRRLSFVVLAFGAIGLAYYSYLFFRQQRGE
jgi:hypothetical protein